MKKSIVLAVVLCIALSFADFNSVASAETATQTEVEFSDIIDISDAGAGVIAGENSGHGGHQTRVVHTSHGDYAAYITNSIKSDIKQMDEFSIVKINAEDGTTELIFSEYKSYDSSQVSLFVDTDENVWAVIIGDNKMNDSFDGRLETLWMGAYKYDPKTGMTTGYTYLVQHQASSGYGYSTSCYDPVNQKIYTLTSSGDQDAWLTWMIFDMETLRWEGVARSINVPTRHCYAYMYADGKGGMVIVNDEDIRCANAGYPEVRNNEGLTAAELASFERWSADYLWDQLDMFYIPDVYKEEYETITVAEADYSRVQGETQEDRYSLEYRKINEYPNFGNNNGGDTFRDNDGYLHVIWAKEYVLAAYTRETSEKTWVHAVYDISDPTDIKLLSSTDIVQEVGTPYQNSFRMYQASNGELYLISGREERTDRSTLIVYKVTGSPDSGYTYEEIASKAYTGNRVINISNNRSYSLADDTICVIYHDQQDDYDYIKITLKVSDAEEPPIDDVTPTPGTPDAPSPTPSSSADPTPTPSEPTPTPSGSQTQNPDDNSNLIIYVAAAAIVVIVLACVIVTVVKKKKKS